METKTLRDVLPHEALSEPKLQSLLDVEVTSEHDGTIHHWPGPHRFVLNWWRLSNGKIVGWNENPFVGWSFPVRSATTGVQK